MPRGIPNKKKETHHETKKEAEVPQHVLKEPEAPAIGGHPYAEKHEPKKDVVVPKVEHKKEVILEPLSAGQAYFEAPDGTIVIGDDSRDQVWHRAGNHGKGMWINKKR